MRAIVAAPLLAATFLGARLEARQEHDHNFYLRAGTEAAANGDAEAYYDNLVRASQAVPEGHINRPFVQYHLARAAALAGHADEVFATFDAMWSERIESLMMSFAAYDPAFDSVRGDSRFAAAFTRLEGLELTATRLRDDVYLLEGAGCNLVASVGSDGALVVDLGYAPALPALRRAVAALGSETIDYAVITHPHEDHMGGLGEIGEEATVVADAGASETIADGYDFIAGVTIPPRSGAALPDIDVAGPVTIHFNGEEVRVIPLPAHTGADLVVYFAGARVLHMGDDYFPGHTPYLNPGPNPMAYLETMEALLDSIPEDGLVVAGHDPVTPVADLRELFARTRVAVEYVAGELEAGSSLERILEGGDQGDAEQQYLRYFYRLLER